MILRLIPALLLGLWVSAFLFWLMHAMLQHHDPHAGREAVTQVEFVRLKHEEPPPETLTRELPPPPVPDASLPPPVTGGNAAPPSPGQSTAPALDLPRLALPVGGGGIATPVGNAPLSLAMPEAGPGSRETPTALDPLGAQLAAIVRIPPTYPLEARRKKIEGWVRMELTVLEDGSVTDVRVKSAEPAGIFEQAAMAAITRWKFRPAMENGKPVRKRAAQTLRFELNR